VPGDRLIKLHVATWHVTAGAVAETPQNHGASQGGATPKPGTVGGTNLGGPSECWCSGWDGEFESPLLQRGVHCEPAMPKERHLISHRGSRDCCAQRLGAAAMVETERMAGSARREAK
jgi:hypothetical protein